MITRIHRSAEGIPLDLILESESEEEGKILVEVYAKQPKFESIGSTPSARVQTVMPIPETAQQDWCIVDTKRASE